METVLLLSVDKYQFPDEKTGEIRKGVTVQYINDYRDDTDDAVGLKPIKAPATDDFFGMVKQHSVPGMYDIDFRTKPGKENKPTLTVVGGKFVRAVKLFDA